MGRNDLEGTNLSASCCCVGFVPVHRTSYWGDSWKIYFSNLDPHLLTNHTASRDHFVISAITVPLNHKLSFEIQRLTAIIYVFIQPSRIYLVEKTDLHVENEALFSL